MFVVYSSSERHLPRVRSALSPHGPVRTVSEWQPFESVMAHALCSVILIEWLSRSHELIQLSQAAAVARAVPVVLVTHSDSENARLLTRVRVQEVVWFSEIERHLPLAVQRASARPVFERLATSVEDLGRLPPLLRRALVHACRSERPVLSVNRLGEEVGRDRRTLWRYWRSAVPAGSELRLEDFLHWLLILHACARKTAHRSWAEVAADLAVDTRTLGRMSRKLTGLPLEALARQGAAAAERQFAERVLSPLQRSEAAPGAAEDAPPS